MLNIMQGRVLSTIITRPITLVIIFMILFSILISIRRLVKENKLSKGEKIND